MKMRLERVRFMPKTLEAGVLYISEEFGAAAHLCACGCGSKIRTPLAPTEWQFEDTESGPTLSPSVGNWQKPCQSHYWITAGEVHWAPQWTPEEIEAGRRAEEACRRAYYEELERSRRSPLRRFIFFVRKLFRR
jgi:hypothetical protein